MEKKLIKQRHNFANLICSGLYPEKEGEIIIRIDNKEFLFKSKNCAVRLDQIFKDLLEGAPKNQNEKEILKIYSSPRLSWEEILGLNIEVREVIDYLGKEIDFALKEIPEKRGGTYKIIFPNGKAYLGSSKDIKKQLRGYIRGLFGDSDEMKYLSPRKDNLGLQVMDLKFEINIGGSIKEEKEKILDKELYYNNF